MFIFINKLTKNIVYKVGLNVYICIAVQKGECKRFSYSKNFRMVQFRKAVFGFYLYNFVLNNVSDLTP